MNDKTPEEIHKLNMVCFYLIATCNETDAKTMTIEQKNVTHFDKNLGDWEIVVRKKSSSPTPKK